MGEGIGEALGDGVGSCGSISAGSDGVELECGMCARPTGGVNDKDCCDGVEGIMVDVLLLWDGVVGGGGNGFAGFGNLPVPPGCDLVGVEVGVGWVVVMVGVGLSGCMTGGNSTRSPWCLRRMGDGSSRVRSLMTVDRFVTVKRTWNSPGQTTGESAANGAFVRFVLPPPTQSPSPYHRSSTASS